MSEKYLIFGATGSIGSSLAEQLKSSGKEIHLVGRNENCLLYTSPSPRDLSTSRMPSSA